MKDVRISVDVLHLQKGTQTPMNKREKIDMFTRSRFKMSIVVTVAV